MTDSAAHWTEAKLNRRALLRLAVSAGAMAAAWLTPDAALVLFGVSTIGSEMEWWCESSGIAPGLTNPVILEDLVAILNAAMATKLKALF